MALTYVQAFALIADWLPGEPVRVLNGGAGTGFLSLEIARASHYVVTVDESEHALTVASDTLRSNPEISTAVTCASGDVVHWTAAPASFDVVVISRALHQVSDPARALAYVRRWLRPDVRLICLDFAFDLFDRRAPRWLATMRSLPERQTSLPVMIWESWRPLPLLSASTRSGSASTWSLACAPPILENEVCS